MTPPGAREQKKGQPAAQAPPPPANRRVRPSDLPNQTDFQKLPFTSQPPPPPAPLPPRPPAALPSPPPRTPFERQMGLARRRRHPTPRTSAEGGQAGGRHPAQGAWQAAHPLTSAPTAMAVAGAGRGEAGWGRAVAGVAEGSGGGSRGARGAHRPRHRGQKGGVAGTP